MKVKDVMHKGVDWVGPDTPVSELAKLMRDHDIGAIPIAEKAEQLVGHPLPGKVKVGGNLATYRAKAKAGAAA